MNSGNRSRVLGAAGACLLILAMALPAAAANVVLINLDPPGTGLNDPTPATPVGGNPGTTLGAQRTNVYLFAAQIWGDTLSSNVPIFVGATFQPLPCSPTGGVLGAAGPTSVFGNFPGAGVFNTWYTGAEADSLAGFDLDPGYIDIISFFNSDIDDNDPACLTGRTWYYGFDNDQGGNLDFLTVVLHEINHGLGNLELVDEGTGGLFFGFPDIYTHSMLDLDLNATWNTLTDAERLASQVNSGNLVWNGANVTSQAPSFLGPRPSIKVLRPQAIKGSYEAQQASFGPPLSGGGGTTGQVVLVDDGSGTATDGCEPIQNNVNGKIALIDRGSCAFTTKVANAEAAGAKGAIVANNVAGGPAPMGGSDPAIGIPSVGVTLDFGDTVKAELPGVNVKLILDDDFIAGTTQGFVRLYAPGVVQPGSSKSHWDTSAEPSLLMEPSITPNLESAQTRDLSPALLQDIGWILLP